MINKSNWDDYSESDDSNSVQEFDENIAKENMIRKYTEYATDYLDVNYLNLGRRSIRYRHLKLF